MKESGYYAPGTEFSPDAPWNRHDPEERELDVDVVVSFTINAPVHSVDYMVEEDMDYDDDGHVSRYVTYEYNGNEIKDFELEYMPLADAIKLILPHIPDDRALRDAIRTLKVYSNCTEQIIEGA